MTKMGSSISGSLRGLQPSENLTGARESASKIAHSHYCWQEASVPSPVDPSIRAHECSCDMLTDFPQTNDPRGQSRVAIYFLALEVAWYHFLCCWSHSLMLEDTTIKVWIPGCEDHLWGGGTFWMLVTTGRDSWTQARIIRKNLLDECSGGGHPSWQEQQFVWHWGREYLVFSRNRYKARLSKWESCIRRVQRTRARLHRTLQGFGIYSECGEKLLAGFKQRNNQITWVCVEQKYTLKNWIGPEKL